MITVYTGRIAYAGIDRLDITVKSAGEIGRVLAPVWAMVMGHKRGILSDDGYTALYIDIMRKRYAQNREAFFKILVMDDVTLCCYCKAGVFCHRHIAVDVLEKIARAHDYEFVRGGER